ncbi:uncharacterized protein LOC130646261 [Hydractinia symbiolongicarpus]|uniref:uncharacterized protein LOC130646261 n=1 Tax=Hydractinia symbiolongicarpus TaxID=13093 RepID=UPI00254B0750|nr:uncharacterized protein LOC130646261 [Hydractinia symbiolongicarpus]
MATYLKFMLLLVPGLVKMAIKAEVFCDVNSLHSSETRYGKLDLKMFYQVKNNNTLRIQCQFYNSTSFTPVLGAFGDIFKFQLYNGTYTSFGNITVKKNITSLCFTLNLVETDFGSAEESFVFIPSNWHLDILSDVGQIIVSGSITIISRQVGNLFSRSMSLLSSSKEFIVKIPCNQEMEYIVLHDSKRNALLLTLKILGSSIGSQTLNISTNASLTHLVITFHHIFVLMHDILYMGKYDTTSEEIVFTKVKTLINQNISGLHYTSYCYIKLPQPEGLETIMLTTRNNKSEIMYSHYPFKEWKLFFIKTWLAEAILMSLHYDVERRNFALHYKNTTSTNNIEEGNSIIYVFRLSRDLFCKPIVFTINITTLQYSYGLFKVKGEREVWKIWLAIEFPPNFLSTAKQIFKIC